MALFQGIEMYSHSSAPSNPTTGYVKIYFEGGYPYWKNDNGIPYQILSDDPEHLVEITTGIHSSTDLSNSSAVLMLGNYNSDVVGGDYYKYNRVKLSTLFGELAFMNEADLTTGNVTQLNDLSDVTIGGAAEGYLLEQASDGSWTNVSKSSMNLSEFNNDLNIGGGNVSTWVKNDFTEDNLFEFLKPFVPNTDDEVLMSGAAVIGTTANYVVNFKRNDATTILIRYIDESATPHPIMENFVIRDGNTNVPFDVLAVSILN